MSSMTVQSSFSLIWEVFRLVKYSAKANDNSASEAATWQLHRQGLAYVS